MRLGLAVALGLAVTLLVAFWLRSSDPKAVAARPRSCTAAELAPAIGERQGVNSVTAMVTLLIRSRSASACSIRGSVALELGPTARGPVVIEPVSGGIFGPRRRRVVLPAGGEAFAGLLILDDCSNPRIPRRVIGLRVRVGSSRSASTPISTCRSGTVIQVGTWQPS